MDTSKKQERSNLSKIDYLYQELFDTKNSDQATVIIKEILDLDNDIQKNILHQMFEDIQYSKKTMDACFVFLKKYHLFGELKKRLDYNHDKERKLLK